MSDLLLEDDPTHDHLSIGHIKKRQDFLAARNGARAHGRAFVLQSRMREDDDPTIRFGYTVTRKVGNAVERNRMRRRFREMIRLALRQNRIDNKITGHDVVIIARRDALTMPFSQLIDSFSRALHHLVAKPGSKGQKHRDFSRRKPRK